MGVPLYIITCASECITQNNLNNFTYIKVTAVKNHTFHKSQNLQKNELVAENTKMAE
jgi:hypothetical protein